MGVRWEENAEFPPCWGQMIWYHGCGIFHIQGPKDDGACQESKGEVFNGRGRGQNKEKSAIMKLQSLKSIKKKN